jgi:nicotinamide riboside kinase
LVLPNSTSMRNSRGIVITLLGAESTGKTTLALALRDALLNEPSAFTAHITKPSVAVVPEYLREFCDRHGRTPYQQEQSQIAEEQTRRIESAAASNDLVIADTTALMIAVYSDQVFGDTSLYPSAQEAQKRYALTLVTALDLDWRPDGLQRDGPHVREPVDARVRAALERAQCAYSVIYGRDASRVSAALACVERAVSPPPSANDSASGWQWHCERCGESNCERHALLAR